MTIKRRSLLKSFGAVTATAVLGTGSAPAEHSAAHRAAAKRPNILVFLTDDHGQWLQEAYGNSEVQTPNMSRIARNGVRMNNAFTTCPVCSPARASFFTGRMPSQHGIHDWIEEKTQAYAYPWLKGQTLISELLKAAGYNTGLVGKWHCGEERYPHPGFDRWFSYWVNQYPHFGQQNFSDPGEARYRRWPAIAVPHRAGARLSSQPSPDGRKQAVLSFCRLYRHARSAQADAGGTSNKV